MAGNQVIDHSQYINYTHFKYCCYAELVNESEVNANVVQLDE